MSSGDASKFWDGEAATFDDEADHGLRDPVIRDAWRQLLRSVLPEPPAHVSDLGCGTGSLSVLLAMEGYRVVGIDSSPRMVEAATRKAIDALGGPNVEARPLTAATLWGAPLVDERYILVARK